MVNLTKNQREVRDKSLADNMQYALDFLRQKLTSVDPLERKEGVTFRFSEFANYIVDKSPEYRQMRHASRNTMTGEYIPKSYFINSYRTRLQHLLDQLIIKEYVRMTEPVTSKRNPEISTRLYKIDAWKIRE